MEPPDESDVAAAVRAGPAELVALLEARLGVAIGDETSTLAALTHKSYVNEHRGEALTDNERLEFLGDAVIDLAVSHRLMERFPGAREGELSKIRASLVDEAGLARLAREIDLGSLLRLGRGEELTGGRQKSSLLADAMEAVVAALYLARGLEPVLAIVDRFLGEAFERAAAGTLDRDYKTQFQELAQSRARATPRYRVFAEHGPDHSKVFEVELELRGEVVGRGSGRSKKDAEQAAAKIALETMVLRLAEGEARSSAPAPPPEVPGAPTPAPAPSEEPAIPVSLEAPPPTQAEPVAAPAEAEVAPPPEEPSAPRRSPRRKAKPRAPSPRAASKAPRRRTGAAAAGGVARRKRTRKSTER